MQPYSERQPAVMRGIALWLAGIRCPEGEAQPQKPAVKPPKKEKTCLTVCKQVVGDSEVTVYRVDAPKSLVPNTVELDIRAARERQGISRKQLAELMGMSYSAVYSWEHGGRTKISTVKSIAKALCCKPEDLLRYPAQQAYNSQSSHAERAATP